MSVTSRQQLSAPLAGRSTSTQETGAGHSARGFSGAWRLNVSPPDQALRSCTHPPTMPWLFSDGPARPPPQPGHRKMVICGSTEANVACAPLSHRARDIPPFTQRGVFSHLRCAIRSPLIDLPEPPTMTTTSSAVSKRIPECSPSIHTHVVTWCPPHPRESFAIYELLNERY